MRWSCPGEKGLYYKNKREGKWRYTYSCTPINEKYVSDDLHKMLPTKLLENTYEM